MSCFAMTGMCSSLNHLILSWNWSFYGSQLSKHGICQKTNMILHNLISKNEPKFVQRKKWLIWHLKRLWVKSTCGNIFNLACETTIACWLTITPKLLRLKPWLQKNVTITRTITIYNYSRQALIAVCFTCLIIYVLCSCAKKHCRRGIRPKIRK